MKFGSVVNVSKGSNKSVVGKVVGMKGKMAKVKQESYSKQEALEAELFGGVWVRKSQVSSL
jgi:hypothetical protein